MTLFFDSSIAPWRIAGRQRQHFRRRSPRRRLDRETASLQSPCPAVNDHNDGHHQQHESDQDECDLVNACIKAGYCRWPRTLPAIEPKKVRDPVATTTAAAVPLTTFVPMKQRSFISRGLAAERNSALGELPLHSGGDRVFRPASIHPSKPTD